MIFCGKWFLLAVMAWVLPGCFEKVVFEPDVDDKSSSSDTNTDAQYTVAFRADTLVLLKPKLWTPGPMTPEVTPMANTILGNLLNQDDNPKDGYYDLCFLVRFDKLDISKQIGPAIFSNCLCPTDGSACSYNSDAEIESNEYRNNNTTSCLNETIPAPCMENDPVDVSMDLGIIGIIYVKQVAIAAPYKSDPSQGFTEGRFRGFVTESVAETITIGSDLSGLPMDIKLTQMLEDGDSEQIEGEKGWWFEYAFDTSPIDFEE